LGLSSSAERETIESEYFANKDAFQEMLTAEDDLIDAYARGELSGEESRGFEKYFVNSLRERNRIQFARAFAGAISATPPVETKSAGTWVDFFEIFRSPGLLQSATVTAVIIVVAVLAWLINDRRRLTNELRELRVESAELNHRTQELQRNSDTDRSHTAEIAAQLAELQSQPDNPRHRERRTTARQRLPHLPEVKNDREEIAIIKHKQEPIPINPDDATLARYLPEKKNEREKFEMFKPKPDELLANSSDATLANTFIEKPITELPLEASLLSLQPGVTRNGYIPGNRADQANITLDGVDVREFTHSVIPRNISNGKTTIQIPSALSWIRFQLVLETSAIHEDCRVIIKTVGGHHVTSVDWIEPLTPNQTIIDTPVLSTDDLSSGDYVLLLMGKDSDGSFVKVAEYSIKVIKN
jgi:hypothetical protein